jgi:hypothetical protein
VKLLSVNRNSGFEKGRGWTVRCSLESRKPKARADRWHIPDVGATWMTSGTSQNRGHVEVTGGVFSSQGRSQHPVDLYRVSGFDIPKGKEHLQRELRSRETRKR